LLEKFGADTKAVDTVIEPESFLVDKGVSFLVQNKVTERGTFANVISESIKPISSKDTI